MQNAITTLSPGSLGLSRIINTYNSQLEGSLKRIATGLRVNSPSDDLHSYFRAQELDRRANTVGSVNRSLEDHLSRIKTAEDAMSTMGDMLDEMAELAKEASSETDASVRASLGKEFDEMRDALDTIVSTTRYKGDLLLTGLYDTSAGGTAINAQVEEETTAVYSYQILDTRTSQATGLNISTINAEASWGNAVTGQAAATASADEIENQDAGLKRLDRNFTRISTNKILLEGAQNNLSNKETNYKAASSALVGVDQAMETSHYASLQIHQQAAASFLAQSNLAYGNVVGMLTGSRIR